MRGRAVLLSAFSWCLNVDVSEGRFLFIPFIYINMGAHDWYACRAIIRNASRPVVSKHPFTYRTAAE